MSSPRFKSKLKFIFENPEDEVMPAVDSPTSNASVFPVVDQNIRVTWLKNSKFDSRMEPSSSTIDEVAKNVMQDMKLPPNSRVNIAYAGQLFSKDQKIGDILRGTPDSPLHASVIFVAPVPAIKAPRR